MSIFVVQEGFDDFFAPDSLGEAQIRKRAGVVKKHASAAITHVIAASSRSAMCSGHMLKDAFGLAELVVANWLAVEELYRAYAGLKGFVSRHPPPLQPIVVASSLGAHVILESFAKEFSAAFRYNDVYTMYAVDIVCRSIRPLFPAW